MAYLLKTEEVANQLRVSEDTVLRLIHGGSLKGLRVGRSWRVRSDDLDAYVEHQIQAAYLPQLVARPYGRRRRRTATA